MKILEFRYITKNDPFNDLYEHWSRKYEYQTVLNYIKSYYSEGFSIHNSSWGFKEHNWYSNCHLRFKQELDKQFGSNNVIHTDICDSKLSGTSVYDITKPPENNFKSKFDIVLNISALEEIPGNHIEHLNNLILNLKDDGYLIVTFDIPGFQLQELEDHLKTKISTKNYNDRIIGHGAPWYDGLNVGLLIMRKSFC